jgi:Signal peptidase, peptidase S26
MPIPVVVAIVASVVALAVLWVAPAAGLVLAGAVIVAGLVLLATCRRRGEPLRDTAPRRREGRVCARDARALRRRLHQARRRRAGDTISFRDGLVVRNGRPVSEPYARSCTDAICELPQAITVPKGAWFLAGDFRGESDDSRFWGPVPTTAITGVVKYRYWPPKDAGRL